MPTGLLAVPLLLLVPQAAEPPTAGELVEQARAFLPVFEADRTEFLTAEQRRHVLASTNLLDASLALEPEQAFTVWWKGHAEALLGEDRRNRGEEGAAGAHYAAALDAFQRAIAIDPSYYWAYYARGMAHNNLGRWWDAIRDYDEAVRVANARIDAAADESESLDPRFVRFKARQWRADTRMRVLEFARAREEFVAFYADNGNNQWDLGFSTAETYQRERDFAQAVATYEHVLTQEDFATFDGAYAQLAYLAGLLGDRAAATRRLDQALETELAPTLYPRLWLWILTEGERRPQAAADLTDFVEHPPAGVSEWDRKLGYFVLGQGTPDEFLGLARAEEERRKRDGVPLDNLMCEVWYYVGLRQEADGNEAAALDAFRRAVAFAPRTFKWEWEYARLGLARLAAALGAEADPGFTVHDDGSLSRDGAEPAEVEVVLVHRPGEPGPLRGVAAVRGRPLLAGDLLQCILRHADGTRSVWTRTVDAKR